MEMRKHSIAPSWLPYESWSCRMVASSPVVVPYSAKKIQTNPTVTYRRLWPKTTHRGKRARHHDQCTSPSASGPLTPRTARHRTGAGAEPEDELEAISRPALGTDCSRGFLYCRTMDAKRPAAIHGAVLPRVESDTFGLRVLGFDDPSALANSHDPIGLYAADLFFAAIWPSNLQVGPVCTA